MNVLVACEESQEVCKAFRERGHRAFSCDIEKCSGGHPEWHILGDCVPILGGGMFITQDNSIHMVEKWDLLIAHPPCTYLTVTANKYYEVSLYGDNARNRQKERYKAIVFFMQMVLAPVEKICVENPIGIMSTSYKKASQIIQPFQFGHKARKATCLWLKGLENLIPTEIVEPELNTYYGKSGKSTVSVSHDVRDSRGHLMSWKNPEVAKLRSKTFTGIAKAMAEQWG